MRKLLYLFSIPLLINFSTLDADAEIKRKKKPEAQKADKKFVLPCAAGTEQFGEGPPKGAKVVCRQPMIGGRFRAEGSMVAWHANGNKKIEGEFVRGDRHGIWTTYQRNGRIKKVETYYAGQRQTVTKFDRYGRPKAPPKEAVSQESTTEAKKKSRLSWRFMRNKK